MSRNLLTEENQSEKINQLVNKHLSQQKKKNRTTKSHQGKVKDSKIIQQKEEDH